MIRGQLRHPALAVCVSDPPLLQGIRVNSVAAGPVKHCCCCCWGCSLPQELLLLLACLLPAPPRERVAPVMPACTTPPASASPVACLLLCLQSTFLLAGHRCHLCALLPGADLDAPQPASMPEDVLQTTKESTPPLGHIGQVCTAMPLTARPLPLLPTSGCLGADLDSAEPSISRAVQPGGLAEQGASPGPGWPGEPATPCVCGLR